MRYGLEVRAPLLDRELFDFVGRAPGRVLRQGGRTKLPFRHVLEPELGAELVDRPKQGFSVPLRQWFRHELRQTASDMLTSPGAFVTTIFPTRLVTRLLREHASGTRNHGDRLWRLLSLELWYQEHARRGAGPH